jgi:electron transfer flavoprotein beta subunit
MGIRKASKITIPTWSAADLNVDPARVGARGSAISWPKISPLPAKEVKVEMISGDSPQQVAAALVDKLIVEKVI